MNKKVVKKSVKKKRGGNFLPQPTNSAARLVRTYFEDVEVTREDGTKFIQKHVPIHRYEMRGVTPLNQKMAGSNDFIDTLDESLEDDIYQIDDTEEYH